jgi:hypothetical protein
MLSIFKYLDGLNIFLKSSKLNDAHITDYIERKSFTRIGGQLG